MEPRIEILDTKKLVGMRLCMSLLKNRTEELWGRFMPRRAEVKDRIGEHFVSLQVFDKKQGAPYLPGTVFEKCAAVEVEDHADTPEGMETYTLDGGKYAVFVHNGPASAAFGTFRHIFGIWLPHSGYVLDDREHFEILPPGYRPDDPDATEEIWIPIR